MSDLSARVTAARQAQAQRRIKQAAIGTIQDAFAETIDKALAQVGIALQDFSNHLYNAVNNTHDDVLARNLYTLGRRAQNEMTESYQALVTSREGAASRTHYRAGIGRLAGGVLLAALGRSDFFDVSGTTLTWGNLEALNAAARQWHRIAAGAGGRGQGIHDVFPVSFAGVTLATIGLESAASPGFAMPRGIWVTPQGDSRVSAGRNPPGSDLFYPQNSSGPQPVETSRGVFAERPSLSAREAGIRFRGRPTGLRATRGIRSHDFFRAGIELIAHDLPTVIQQYAHDVTGQWLSAAQINRVIKIRVTAKGLGVNPGR